MLTKKQKELLEYIQNYQTKSGVTPSYEEMKGALNLKSKSGIHRLVIALEERGFVRRLAHKARALEVIKDAISTLKVSEKTNKNIIIGDFTGSNKDENSKLSTLPLLGKIAAGTPIEAIQHLGMLDITILNIDRNDGNVIVEKNNNKWLSSKRILSDEIFTSFTSILPF